jgi:hypothetical protein
MTFKSPQPFLTYEANPQHFLNYEVEDQRNFNVANGGNHSAHYNNEQLPESSNPNGRYYITDPMGVDDHYYDQEGHNIQHAVNH